MKYSWLFHIQRVKLPQIQGTSTNLSLIHLPNIEFGAKVGFRYSWKWSNARFLHMIDLALRNHVLKPNFVPLHLHRKSTFAPGSILVKWIKSVCPSISHHMRHGDRKISLVSPVNSTRNVPKSILPSKTKTQTYQELLHIDVIALLVLVAVVENSYKNSR